MFKKCLDLGLVTVLALTCSLFGQPDSQPLYAPVPPYPREARAKEMSGAGWYVLDIDSNGRVGRAIIAISSGHKLLDKVALSTFKQWRFRPGTVSRVKVPARWTLDSER